MEKSTEKESLLCEASFYCYYIDIRLAIKTAQFYQQKSLTNLLKQ